MSKRIYYKKKTCPKCGHQGFRRINLCRRCRPKKRQPIRTCPICGHQSPRKRKHCFNCAPFFRKWTPKEDKIVRKIYPHKGADGVLKILTDRTRNTIINRANRLGIKMTKEASHKFIHSHAAEYMRNHNPSKKPGASERLRKRQIQLWKDKPYIPERLFEGQRKIQKDNPTGLEKKLCVILDKLNVDYIAYKIIKPKFIVDIEIDNRIIIEADGDWWHGHPRFEPLNENQIRQQKRDKSKDAYLTKCGYTVYRIWEHDMSFSKVKDILIKEDIIL